MDVHNESIDITLAHAGGEVRRFVWIQRLLESRGHACWVVSPSLIPRQLHDVQQSGANHRTHISSIHRRFSGPVAFPVGLPF
jgi:hypothetical protein